MRQWMVDPKIMCDKHLLGEHVEHHMFIGTLKKRKSVDGYIKNDLLEPKSLYSRHHELVQEMENRGMKHKSELTRNDMEENIDYLPLDQQNHIIDDQNSLQLLISRCPKCAEKYKENAS
jgi:hypothetical protein